MVQQNNRCDESQLAILLAGDEQSDEFRRSAAHVEFCERCQHRLTTLAADDQTWSEVTKSFDDVDNPFKSVDTVLTTLAPSRYLEMFEQLARYEVGGVIGSGGMGVVLKGHDTELNRPVAIKLLAQHLAHNGVARQRFAREARAAAAVVHEHVVAIHDIESDADTPYIVMQYVPGESLQKRVDTHGPLGVKEVLRIGMQTAAGLAAAHAQGVVHRDIKPSNILLEHGVDRALLADFGLARVADDATVTQTGIVAGTPDFMSPEQANGEVIDPRSDLFSLGSVLYFMATGRTPFRAERALAVLKRICHNEHRPAWEINPEVPDELSDAIDRLLEKKPQRRYASADQTREVLSTMLAKLQETGSLSRRGAARGRSRRRRRWLAYGTLIAMVVTGILSVSQMGLERVFDSAAQQETRQPAPDVADSSDSTDRMPAIVQEDSLIFEISPIAEFSAELSGIQNALQQLETPSVTGESPLFYHGSAEWQSELSAIEDNLSEAESSFIHPLSTGEKL